MIVQPGSDLMLNRDKSIYHLSLKPRDISDIIITVVDPSMVHKVSNLFDSVDFEMNTREFITHTGKHKKRKVTVISTGIGSDNVEILLTELDALVNLNFKTGQPNDKHRKLKLIRLGNSAAIQEDIVPGEVIMAESAIGLDSLLDFYEFKETTEEKQISQSFSTKLKLVNKPYCSSCSAALSAPFNNGIMKGNTLSFPGFYAPQGRSLRLPLKMPKMIDQLARFHNNDFWLTDQDMQTAMYYSLGRLLGHEIISLNLVTYNHSKNTFLKNENKAFDHLVKEILDLVITF